MVHGVWYMVYGIGIWYMVYGVWYMMYGVWYMVYGIYGVYGMGYRGKALWLYTLDSLHPKIFQSPMKCSASIGGFVMGNFIQQLNRNDDAECNY